MRKALVTNAFRSEVMNTGQAAIEVHTDFADKPFSAFCIPDDVPEPTVAQPIEYGDRHVIYSVAGREVRTHQLGYEFDPDGPFQ
jgi:hypothetical protein